MRIFSFLISKRKIVIQVEETIGGDGWDGDYSMMQWLYMMTKEDMNGQNLIAGEQIKNDANSEKEILDAYDRWDWGDFRWLVLCVCVCFLIILFVV